MGSQSAGTDAAIFALPATDGGGKPGLTGLEEKELPEKDQAVKDGQLGLVGRD